MVTAYRAWKSDQKMEKKRALAKAGGAEEVNQHWLPTSVISYPFVLTAATKARVLQLDAQQQMQEGVQNEVYNAIILGQRVHP